MGWMHPQVRALPDTVGPIDPERLHEQRAAVVAATPLEAGPGAPLHRVVDLVVDAVPCRLYLPSEGSLPVIVFAHGGGWVDGNLETHDPLCRLLADRSGCAVIAVDYRLAPEHPWPAASDDLDTIIAWARAGGRSGHGLDGTRVALCGDSSGGHLTAVAARRWRDRGAGVRAQALFYPVTDPEGSGWGAVVHPGLKADNMRWCWDAFVPAGVDRSRRDVTPGVGGSTALRGMPPTLVVTAEHDILRVEGEAYAAALADAGVPTVTFQARGLVHGFVRRLARFDAAQCAVELAAAYLRRHLS